MSGAIPVSQPMTDAGLVENLNSIQRLTRDLKNASRTLSDKEARFLVDAYYAMQRDRIRAAHQERTLSKGNEPHDVMSWLADQRETLEEQVRRALDAYSASHIEGVWARSMIGIGPVIAAGLLANIDITLAPTVGHIWRFAGLDPTRKWDKATKRPWNGNLKRLCFLIGESFVKVSNNDNDVYGKIYKARKSYETAKNERGDYADQAKVALATKKFGADTDARKHYEAGHLPPARIHLRSCRYAVKLFLAHYHHVAYESHFGSLPDKPYVLTEGAHLAHPELAAHTHYVAPPNWPLAEERATQPEGTRAPSMRSEPSAPRAPQETSEPSERRAPKSGSEPKQARAPKRSEPSSQSAPSAKSEPDKGRAPDKVSEPASLSAPTMESEPNNKRAPKGKSKALAISAQKKVTKPRHLILNEKARAAGYTINYSPEELREQKRAERAWRASQRASEPESLSAPERRSKAAATKESTVIKEQASTTATRARVARKTRASRSS